MYCAAFRRDAEQTRWFYEKFWTPLAAMVFDVVAHRKKKPVHAFIFWIGRR